MKFTLFASFITVASSFTTKPAFLSKTTTSLGYSVHDDETPIQCFLIQTDDDEEDPSPPRVVCTSQAKEYAWFNGIDEDQMVPTDGMYEDSLECVETESPRGVTEWECRSIADAVAHAVNREEMEELEAWM